MEATATRRDGGSGPSSWRRTYKSHEQMGSAGSYTRSSRSGTIVSTAYTSGASHSSLSTGLGLKIHRYEHPSWGQRTKEQDKKIKQQEMMKRVMELINGGIERWFTKLEVAWVFDLHDDAFLPEIVQTRRFSRGWIGLHAPTWIHALAEIVETIRFTQTQWLPEEPNQSLRRVTSKIVQRVKSKLFFTNEVVTDDRIPDQIQFARFIQEAMLELLAFVDDLVPEDLAQEFSFHYGNWETHSYHKSLNLLLGVHDALYKALHVIEVLFISSPPGEVQRILGEIFRLLSTKEDKALDAIWLTLNDYTTHVLKQIQDSSAIQTLQQGSSDIHKVTRSVISYISFLMDNKYSLDLIISEADNRGKVSVYQSRIVANQKYLNSMMTVRDMASRLQEELASLESETFPEQGLMFLFLLNNSHQLHQCLLLEPGWPSLQPYAESLLTKVDGYMQNYLQVSWAPVLSCLFNPTIHVLGKNYSLTRFESEFQETYITQKHWKVPDPGVRKNLRTAIIKKIVPGYTKYIEENNITTPRFAPQELEEMLQDLFEG